MLINHKCSKCGLTQLVKMEQQYVYKNNRSSKIYRDHLQRRLVGNQCHGCRNKQVRFHNNKRDRRDSKNPRVIRELWAVDRAKKRLEDCGFKVEEGHGRGPDLYCYLGSDLFDRPILTMTVEVKAICRNNATYGWTIGEVKKCRRKDDLLAIILPNGYAHTLLMADYINAQPRSDIRRLTEVVKKYGTAKI